MRSNGPRTITAIQSKTRRRVHRSKNRSYIEGGPPTLPPSHVLCALVTYIEWFTTRLKNHAVATDADMYKGQGKESIKWNLTQLGIKRKEITKETLQCFIQSCCCCLQTVGWVGIWKPINPCCYFNSKHPRTLIISVLLFPTFSSSSILTLENLQAIHSGKEKKKMSKGSSTIADKEITSDPLNFFCTATSTHVMVGTWK